jgi:hypothetical protein
VQINPELLRSVVFVCWKPLKNDAPVVPFGTAFLISPYPLPGSKRRWVYLVTAAHLIDYVETALNVDGLVWIRFNGKDGNLQTTSTKPSEWIRHPDPGADVAALRWPLDKGIGDHIAWSMEVQLIDDLIQKYAVGPGDDVFIIGLFSKAEGKTRNIPIARVGNIAAMPTEPLRTKKGTAKVFLIEARSIGGLSGSPVFLHLGHMRLLEEDKRGIGTRGVFMGLPKFWMGMIHGHYDDVEEKRQELVNMGIALVIPHERIVDVINSPKEIQLRRDMEKE